MAKIKAFMYMYVYFIGFRVDKYTEMFTYVHIYFTEDGAY